MKRDETAVLTEKRRLSEDAFLLTFEAPGLSSALPGQFTMLRVSGGGLLLRRPYSFCHLAPEAGRFTLLVKVVGQGTKRLADIPPGGLVSCLGPLGTAFALPPGDVRIVMVAGGVGIAPFVGLSERLARFGRRAIVLLGGRGAPDLYLREEFGRLGMEVSCATEDGSYGERGLVTALLPRALSNGGAVHIYSCGPSGMLRAVALWARERGLPHHVSIERRMGCGMGCCLGCVVFTRRAGEPEGEYRRGCTEGPVFDASEICWDRDPHPL